jgi:peroxiredoxin
VTDPVVPEAGWGVLHLFGKVRAGADGEAVAAAVKSLQAEAHQVVSVALLGHKADMGLMALGPDLWRLRALQTAVQSAGLEVSGSYLSLTEVSEYAQGMPDELKRTRLYPRLPPEAKPAFCFYPMSKRRNVGQNWYAEPYERREQLMQGHGAIGRTFAGRVVQLITGSTGLDDYEWGVTLFAITPDVLKEVVYTMRFDEASAQYAEFGPFFAGMVADIDDVLAAVGLA